MNMKERKVAYSDAAVRGGREKWKDLRFLRDSEEEEAEAEAEARSR